MFFRKAANNLIKKIHKRSVRVVYEMEGAIFEDLLINNSSWTIYENNIYPLLIQICKSLNHISPSITCEIFDLKNTPHSLRCNNQLKLP